VAGSGKFQHFNMETVVVKHGEVLARSRYGSWRKRSYVLAPLFRIQKLPDSHC
jgi:hypothetical protein